MPVGGGLVKTFQIGEQPLKLTLNSYYNANQPSAGNDTWLLQATLTSIFPVPGSSGSRPEEGRSDGTSVYYLRHLPVNG